LSVRAGVISVIALAVLVLPGLNVSGTDAGLGTPRARAAVSQTLNAGFDADGNIYLTFADGTRIGTPNPPGTVVPAGTYTINLNNNSLDDLGNPHSFHLFGPGVNLAAGGTVQATWTATFQVASSYTYQDDLNPTTIHDVFGTPGSGATSTTVPVTTTPVTTTPGTKTTPAPTSNSPLASKVPVRGTLLAGVTAAGKLTLSKGGKAVTSIVSGRYTIKVTDSSRTSGFTLQETKKAAQGLTGEAFRGKKSKTLVLSAGQWFFYNTFVGKKSYFIVTN
jgi:hypothetical protein